MHEMYPDSIIPVKSYISKAPETQLHEYALGGRRRRREATDFT